jgi:hypothetical protein
MKPEKTSALASKVLLFVATWDPRVGCGGAFQPADFGKRGQPVPGLTPDEWWSRQLSKLPCLRKQLLAGLQCRLHTRWLADYVHQWNLDFDADVRGVTGTARGHDHNEQR